MHSCSTAISGNYDGAIRTFWNAQFDALQNGERVVDIGTGNGALPLLAKDSAARRGIFLDIHGVDIADIDPPATVKGGEKTYEGVKFHPKTSSAHLPFPDGSVTLVCSQFAFEYTPRQATISEILRVIGRDGRAAFVVHSDRSIIATISEQQLAGCCYLLQGDIFANAHAMIGVLSKAPNPALRSALANDPHAESARTAFNTSAAALMEMMAANENAAILRKTADQIRNALSAAGHQKSIALSILDSAQAAVNDEKLRLQQLRRALVNPDELAAIASFFRSAGYTVTSSSLEQRPGIEMGWTLVVGNG
ncbi:class I SAM-dependent methyltransferase [Pseudoxanthomonas sp. UTMC 1351]|uniref:class I SAM-dependent methyltransferase n=1 Tax=Pseudoxanthomonas sp. UTMC 1351 TaxID=2695853 RepID=UPI0034CD63BB